MEYDFLKIKSYQERIEKESGGKKVYILSFGEEHHMKVSPLAKEIMDCFDGKKTGKEIINELHSKNIMFEHSDFIKFVNDILIKNSLLEGMNFNSVRKSKSRLWIHIPLISSSKFKKLYNILKFFYQKNVFITTVSLIAICIGYNLVNDMLNGSLRINVKETNSVGILCFLYFSLIAHEFGHITAASKYNVESGDIGIGMYLFNPVVYVDMTNSWRLSKEARVLTDIGGVYFQNIMVVPLTLLTIITNSYTIRVSIMAVVFMSLINFMPFLKLDGYWLLTDSLALINVSEKSVSFVKNSIHMIFKEHKLNFIGNKNKLNSKDLVYFIYGVLYLISTLIMFILGISMSISLVKNYTELIRKIHLIIYDICNFNIRASLSNINNIFFSILPLFFIVYFICEFIKGIFRKLIKE